MRSNFLKVYVHLVWSTWDKLPFIDERRKTLIYETILNEASQLRTKVHAIGGTDNHVHVLLELPNAISLRLLLNQLKGKTSALCGKNVQWRRTYAALSVSKLHVPMVIKYMQNQEQHHKTNVLMPSLELTDSGRAGELSAL